MNLNQKPETLTWPAMHYVYIERIGPFQDNAALAWQGVHALVPEVSAHNEVTGYMSLYDTKKMIYRAGLSLSAAPKKLPKGLDYVHFAGGKYTCFVLTGSYSNLPQASAQVFEKVAAQKIPRREDFCIENYANDPRTTPEELLVTEILIPTL